MRLSRVGRHIPPQCREPTVLQRSTVCALDSQMKRLMRTPERAGRLLVLVDDPYLVPRANHRAMGRAI